MLGRERTVDRRQLVVIEAIKKDGQVTDDGDGIEGIETHPMPSFGVGNDCCSRGKTGGGCGVRAHFLITCSSVLTENFLYAENWCKLRQCCLGVSTSTRAWVGNQ